MGSLIPYRFREGFVPVRSRAGVLVCYWFGGIPTQLQLDIFSLDHIGVLTPIFLLAGMIVTSALIIWKGLIVFTGSESPVVVVLSGSMEPGFKRVSSLLKQNWQQSRMLYVYMIVTH